MNLAELIWVHTLLPGQLPQPKCGNTSVFERIFGLSQLPTVSRKPKAKPSAPATSFQRHLRKGRRVSQPAKQRTSERKKKCRLYTSYPVTSAHARTVTRLRVTRLRADETSVYCYALAFLPRFVFVTLAPVLGSGGAMTGGGRSQSPMQSPTRY